MGWYETAGELIAEMQRAGDYARAKSIIPAIVHHCGSREDVERYLARMRKEWDIIKRNRGLDDGVQTQVK